MKVYTITDSQGRIRSFSRGKIAWRSVYWAMYRLRRLDRTRYDIHICDLDVGTIDKINANVFYETHLNPKVSEAEIQKLIGVNISLQALKQLYDNQLLNDNTRSLVKVYLESKGIF